MKHNNLVVPSMMRVKGGMLEKKYNPLHVMVFQLTLLVD